MKNFYLLFVFLTIVSIGSPSSSPQKTKCVTRMYNWVSDWISKAQYQNIFNDLEPSFYNEASPEEIGSKMVTVIMSRLTFTQMLQVAAFGTQLLGKLDYYLNVTMTVLSNNLSPFALQLNQVTHAYKQKGIAMLPTITRGYVKISQFATPKRIETIMCRMKPNFGADWPTVYNFVINSKVFRFPLYPCTKP